MYEHKMHTENKVCIAASDRTQVADDFSFELIMNGLELFFVHGFYSFL